MPLARRLQPTPAPGPQQSWPEFLEAVRALLAAYPIRLEQIPIEHLRYWYLRGESPEQVVRIGLGAPPSERTAS